MLTEVMEHYGLVRDFRKAGYYETRDQQQMFKDIKSAIYAGKLIALTGVIGCGKTVTLRKLQESLVQEGRVLVSKSLAVDKARTTLPTLIAALFYDLSPDKDVKNSRTGRKTRARSAGSDQKRQKAGRAVCGRSARSLQHDSHRT